MIIWSGMGFLVAVIAVACLYGTQYLVNSHFQDPQFYQTHDWPKLVGCLIAGVLVGVVGRSINYREANPEPDPDTGIATRSSASSFFFIPMQYWGPIIVVLGFVFVFTRK